ncbi:MAG: PEGA domain-containing protein [Desulfobacteraceae bacterium]|nr:PEGA domain-containing protein [Desulfobacteraceae bacterium]
MANGINSGATLEKRKKSRQKQNKDPDKWTFGRSLLFLLITFDLIAVLAWLIYYHSYYENISRIVGGVWAAVLTFLSYMKIKRGRKRSLVEFLQILPVKMVIITYTIIIFLIASIFVFAEFPVHTVHITAYFNNKPQSGALIFLDNKTYKTEEDGTYEIHSVEAGEYNLSGSWKGNISDTIIVNVPWWQLKNYQKLIIPTPPPPPPLPPRPLLPGKIYISSNFNGEALNGAEIYIDGKKQGKQTPATLKIVPAGEYSIKLIKTYDDYCYEGEKEITVEAGKTTVAEMGLKLVGQLCKLEIRSNPTDASIYINEKSHGTTNTTVKLCPGTYKIRLEKSGYKTTDREVIIKEPINSITIPLSIE